jgi:tetratricopeptide (TPR) repeat protein
MRTSAILTVLALLLAAPTARAADVSEAQELYDEAQDTLKKNSVSTVPPKDYATAMLKLEKASEILDKGGQNNSQLASDVAAANFWAGRCSNVKILAELDKLRAAGGLPPRPPRKAKGVATEEGGLAGLETDSEAAKAFQAAQEYADGNKEEDFKQALRWFQVAGEHPGTVHAYKALQLSQQALARFLAKNAANTEQLEDTPENKPVKEGDILALGGDYEKAIGKYKESLRLKNTILAQRRLGHAYYLRAQQMKDDLVPKWQDLKPKYIEAWQGAWSTGTGGVKYFRNDYGPYAAVKPEFDKIDQQLRRALSYYQEGRWAFESILKQAPAGKDLDAAAHVALCYCIRPEDRARTAANQLKSFLQKYEAGNDTERMLYEYCKIELEGLTAKK